MAKQNLLNYFTSLVSKKMQIKTTRYYFTPTRIAKFILTQQQILARMQNNKNLSILLMEGQIATIMMKNNLALSTKAKDKQLFYDQIFTKHEWKHMCVKNLGQECLNYQYPQQLQVGNSNVHQQKKNGYIVVCPYNRVLYSYPYMKQHE